MTFAEKVAAARQTPWKARNEIRRIMWMPWIRMRLAAQGIEWRTDWRIYGAPLVQRHRGSRIAIGPGLEMRNWRSSNPLGVAHPCVLATWSPDAAIVIGERVGLTGVSICAARAISIGNRVMIGANAVIVDTDFHPLDPLERQHHPARATAAPVVIEDDCFIGMRALVLKGSRIGRGAIVGAGSVVSGEIPPGVVAAGNPARPIGQVGRAGSSSS
jgi:acetyltransferase-like isoleucine patch superfamily enzyme